MGFRLQAHLQTVLAKLSPEHVDRAAKATLHGLNTQGGSTVHVQGHEVPSRGYMVGAGDDRVFDHTPTHEHVKSFIHEHADKLKKADHFLGSWEDPESGKTALDVSRHFPDAASAHAHARKSNEKAIYELHTGNSIPTDYGDGKPGKARM